MAAFHSPSFGFVRFCWILRTLPLLLYGYAQYLGQLSRYFNGNGWFRAASDHSCTHVPVPISTFQSRWFLLQPSSMEVISSLAPFHGACVRWFFCWQRARGERRNMFLFGEGDAPRAAEHHCFLTASRSLSLWGWVWLFLVSAFPLVPLSSRCLFSADKAGVPVKCRSSSCKANTRWQMITCSRGRYG